MKKIILLIIAVFFLTGCDAEYTLEISNDVKENTKIYTLKTDESKYGDSFLKDFLNQQTLSNIPIYFNPSNYDELNGEKQEGVLYYDITSYEENAFTGIEANTDLFSLTSIVRSRAIKSCYEEVTIQKNNSLYRMNTNSTCKAFENYKLLENLAIHIKTSYDVIYHNADQVDGEIYTWLIDKNNYKEKPISFVINTDPTDLSKFDPNNMEEIKEPEKNWVNQHQILVVIFFFVTFTIVILILVTKNGKRK